MPNIPHPRHIQWGRIVTQGFDYQITPRDACCLAISTKREDRVAPEYIIWCYVQRLAASQREGAVVNGRRRTRQGRLTLGTLVIQHSQPINPIWAWPGEQNRIEHYKGSWNAYNARNPESAVNLWNAVRRLPASQRTGPFAQRLVEGRRNRIRLLHNIIAGDEGAWERSVPGNIKVAVLWVLTGQVGNMCPGYTDFATTRAVRRNPTAVRLGGGVRTNGDRTPRNYFIRNQPSLGGVTVQIIAPNGETSLIKPRRNFPPQSGYQSVLADEGSGLGISSPEIVNVADVLNASGGNELPQRENLPRGTDVSGEEEPPIAVSNNVSVSTSGVPDATSTIQRYTSLRGSVLMQQIRDNWATEIEELLYTFDP